MNKNYLLFLIMISYLTVYSQSDNDNMEDAEALKMGQFVNSFTHGNTLQRDCIDETLTGKCIKYHNDQWFTFNSGTLTHLFINISNQECRDLYGVQLIVLDGELCRPETYEILDCVSLSTQDDIFVELQGLKLNHKYWVIIDGYLHDFCKFHIEVSEKSSGVSIRSLNLLKSKTETSENVVNLNWSIPDSLSGDITQVHIVKRSDKMFRFEQLDSIPITYNTYGVMEQNYQYSDTLLRSGQYYYRLVMEDNRGNHYFNSEFVHKVYSPLKSSPINKAIMLELDFRNYTPITILIIDGLSEEVLDEIDMIFDIKSDRNFGIYTNKYANREVKVLEVHVINNDNGRRDISYYRLDENLSITD